MIGNNCSTSLGKLPVVRSNGETSNSKLVVLTWYSGIDDLKTGFSKTGSRIDVSISSLKRSSRFWVPETVFPFHRNYPAPHTRSLPVSCHFRGCKVPLFRIVSGAIPSELAFVINRCPLVGLVSEKWLNSFSIQTIVYQTKTLRRFSSSILTESSSLVSSRHSR